MIDTSRWLLVETWLALGLRIEWCPSYRRLEGTGEQWMDCDETNQKYFYERDGTWRVMSHDDSFRRFTKPECPQLGTLTMRHELAHYLVATALERQEFNFKADDEAERRTMEVEKVIEAMLAGANRITAAALRS